MTTNMTDEQKCARTWEDIRPIGGTFWHELDERTRHLAIACFKAGKAFLSSNDEGVTRPTRVQAVFEVWRNNAEVGPNASALFEYIETLEATLSTKPEAGKDRHIITGGVIQGNFPTREEIPNLSYSSPASGEQMEVVARYDASAIMYSLDGVEPKPHPLGDWVKYSDHAATLDAAQKVLAERDALYQSAVKGRSDFRQAYRDAKSRAETAEALNTTLSEALEPFAAMSDELENEPSWRGVLEHDHPLAGRVNVSDFRAARTALRAKIGGHDV